MAPFRARSASQPLARKGDRTKFRPPPPAGALYEADLQNFDGRERRTRNGASRELLMNQPLGAALPRSSRVEGRLGY